MSLKSPVTGLRSPISGYRQSVPPTTSIQLLSLDFSQAYSDEAQQNVASYGDSIASIGDFVSSVQASRPVLAREPVGGVRNAILYSNTFSDVSWLRTNSNVSTVADGWKLSDSGAGGTNTVIIRQIYTAQPGVNSFSVEAKQDQLDQIALRAFSFDSDSTSYFSLSAGTVLSEGASHSASISSVGDGWYRVGIEFVTSTDVSGLLYVYAASSLNPVVPLDGTSSILIRRAQGEAGASSSYQETTNEYDVTEIGVESLEYLSFDGVDDEMSISSFDTDSNSWTVAVGANSVSTLDLSFSNANTSLGSSSFSTTVNSVQSNALLYSTVAIATHRLSNTGLANSSSEYAFYTSGEYANASAEFNVSGGAKLYALEAYSGSLSGEAFIGLRANILSLTGEA